MNDKIVRQYVIANSYTVYTQFADGRLTRHITAQRGDTKTGDTGLEVLERGLFFPKHDPKFWDWTGRDLFFSRIAHHEFNMSLDMARTTPNGKGGWLLPRNPPPPPPPQTKSKYFDPKAERKLDGFIK